MSQGKKLKGGEVTRFKFSIGRRDLERFASLAQARNLEIAEYLRRLMRRELRDAGRESEGGEGNRGGEPIDPLRRLLPHERSHLGGPGVGRMRRAGLSEDEIKRRVTDWLLKPIPREDRLNGYTRELRLKPGERLIHHLTYEQRQKAESIYRYLCEKHKVALHYHPCRRGVYWACAVSRVRAGATYGQQRGFRNRLKGPLNRIVGLGASDNNLDKWGCKA